jgi:cation transport ATPase
VRSTKEKQKEKRSEVEERSTKKKKKKKGAKKKKKKKKKERSTEKKRKKMTKTKEPSKRNSITWGFLCGGMVVMFFTLGMVLRRSFDPVYARALGISILFLTAILVAPLAKLHTAQSV